MNSLDQIENRRLEIQFELDSQKSSAQRNKLGQFATPTPFASFVLEKALAFTSEQEPIRFLDPAIGTGSFYSALLRNLREERIHSAVGYEIDEDFVEEAKLLWRQREVDIFLGDFTLEKPPENESKKFNLIVCNPPYVRHHHIEKSDKKTLQSRSYRNSDVHPNGLSGLYVHFMLISHAWMRDDGIAAWLIPSEFMDVNYGDAIREYLTKKVRLLEVHRFDPTRTLFDDALVTSSVILFKKAEPRLNETVPFFVHGASGQKPKVVKVKVKELKDEYKWSKFLNQTSRRNTQKNSDSGYRVKDVFKIQRGIATGANSFFIKSADEIEKIKIPARFLVPILPSPRYLESNIIEKTQDGMPVTDKPLFLIDCNLEETIVEKDFPEFYDYLQRGIDEGINERYLCKNRSLWYQQEKRNPSPFLCTYMGRPSGQTGANPFRFVRNKSIAVAPNVYLNIYPRKPLRLMLANDPALYETIHNAFQNIPADRLIREGRVYGGGLFKLEPSELGNIPLESFFGELANRIGSRSYQMKLIA